MDPTSSIKTVAVIGGGASGLVAVKQCLEESLQPTCFEQHDHIGGTWYYTEKPRDNQTAPCFKSLVTNAPKETMSFSDFPFSDNTPEFMTSDWYLEYLDRYADHFHLRNYIHTNTRVMQIRPLHSDSKTVKWVLTIGKTDEKETNDLTFDAVLVCSGFLKKPRFSPIPDQEIYKGKIMHSAHYRRPEGFTKKRVLVIGKQSSAADVSCDATATADKVYLSIGDGTLLIPRFTENMMPLLYVAPRFIIPYQELVLYGSRKCAFERFDHITFNINNSSHTGPGDGFMVTDDVQCKVVNGRLTVVGGVERFTETGVQIADGTRIDVDVVVFATGFRPDFSFIKAPEICSTAESIFELSLYKNVFPLETHLQSLAFICMHGNVGAVPPSAEIESRWATRVFAGRCTLPPKDVMKDYFNKVRDDCMANCKGKFRRTVTWNCDEVAEEIGAKPRFWPIFLRSPLLAFRVFVGPAFNVHYRLLGPGSCQGAVDESHRLYDRYKRVSKVIPWINRCFVGGILIFLYFSFSAIVEFLQ